MLIGQRGTEQLSKTVKQLARHLIEKAAISNHHRETVIYEAIFKYRTSFKCPFQDESNSLFSVKFGLII